MVDGYSADTAEMITGSSRVRGLGDQSRTLGTSLSSALAGLTAAAGNPDLAGALESATVAAARVMLDTGSLLDHVGQGLVQTAHNYDKADQVPAQHLTSIMRGIE